MIFDWEPKPFTPEVLEQAIKAIWEMPVLAPCGTKQNPHLTQPKKARYCVKCGEILDPELSEQIYQWMVAESRRLDAEERGE